MVKIFEEWLVEAFADKYGKHMYAELSHGDLAEYGKTIIDLIKIAYADKGGSNELKTLSDLKNTDLTYWIAKDIDNDPDADMVLGGKTTPAGIKLVTMGQDGSREAKSDAIKKMIELMKTRGFYAEMDPELAQKLGLTPLKGEDRIAKILKKDIKYSNDGTYERDITGLGTKTKVLVGIPKI
jgi:hypothetical protein